MNQSVVPTDASVAGATSLHGPNVVKTSRKEDLMQFLQWLLLVAIWIAIAFWPARVAGRKGHSFVGYFIFSLFFFPAALIVAYVVSDRTRVPVG